MVGGTFYANNHRKCVLWDSLLEKLVFMLKTQYLLQMASTNANGPRTYCIIPTHTDSLGRVILG